MSTDKRKFKVGDLVANRSTGVKGVITDINHRDCDWDFKVRWEDKSYRETCIAEHIRHVDVDQPKFKVGDIVTVLTAPSFKRMRITKIEPHPSGETIYRVVSVDDNTVTEAHNYGYWTDCLVLAPDQPKCTNFVKGDRVRVKELGNKVFTIIEVGQPGTPFENAFHIQGTSGSAGWWNASFFELERSFLNPEPEAPRFRIGDIVRRHTWKQTTTAKVIDTSFDDNGPLIRFEMIGMPTDPLCNWRPACQFVLVKAAHKNDPRQQDADRESLEYEEKIQRDILHSGLTVTKNPEPQPGEKWTATCWRGESLGYYFIVKRVEGEKVWFRGYFKPDGTPAPANSDFTKDVWISRKHIRPLPEPLFLDEYRDRLRENKSTWARLMAEKMGYTVKDIPLTPRDWFDTDLAGFPFLDEHSSYPADLYRATLDLIQAKDQPAMNPINIENKTFVNGSDVSQLSDQQIVGLIKQSEKQVEDLQSLKHKPKRIAKLIEDIEAGIAKLVAVLDERDETKH